MDLNRFLTRAHYTSDRPADVSTNRWQAMLKWLAARKHNNDWLPRYNRQGELLGNNG